MLRFSRREVLRALAATAVGGGVLHAARQLAWAVGERPQAASLVWLNPDGTDGNFLAVLGQAVPEFLGLIANRWELEGFEPLLPTGFRPPKESEPAAPILVLESPPGPPEADPELAPRVAALLPGAKAAILLGTEACFGGPGVAPEAVAAFERLCREHKTPLIKLPGIPVPPQHLVGTVGHLEFFGFPRLDALRRPLLYYREPVCNQCERRTMLEQGHYAAALGEAGCLLELGCKGPITYNSCSAARWNGGENWCVGAGGPCTGCSEPGFPRHGGLGLYGRLSGGSLAERSLWLRTLEGVGLGILGLAGVGLTLRLARNALVPWEREDGDDRPGERG